MEAPKCRNFPSCGKRHYGDCGSGASGERPDGSSRKKSAAKKKSQEKKLLGRAKAAPTPEIKVDELLARLESLESRVEKLETRKRYQRELMRKRRSAARQSSA